jgi:glycosyltransferase involved in cell wall biosynthesis
MVATIAPHKCQDIFIRTAALIRQSCPEVVFVIVGEPFVWAEAYWHRLQMLVAHLDLGAQVIFTGYRTDVPALMKRFDVLMHPSSREALGGVLIEAMALGVPVVASTADGIPEIVRDGETGVLVASGNAADYARAVVKLLRNPDVASAMAARAKEWAQQFDGARVTRSVEECYRAVLSSRKRSLTQSRASWTNRFHRSKSS